MWNTGGGMLPHFGVGVFILLSEAAIQTWQHLNICPRASGPPSRDTWVMVSSTLGTKLWD